MTHRRARYLIFLILSFCLFWEGVSFAASPKSIRLKRSTVVVLKGTLRILVADDFHAHSSKLIPFLDTPKGSIAIMGNQLGKIRYRSGDRMIVRGTYDRRKRQLKISRVVKANFYGDAPTPQVLPLSSVSQPMVPPSFAGERRILALIGSFTDMKAPCGAAEIHRAMISDPDSTQRLIHEASSGRISLQTDIQDSIQLDIPFSSYNCAAEGGSLDVVGDAFKKAAKNLDIDVTKYDHLVYVFPGPRCRLGGIAKIGGNEVWSHECSSRVITHELGHDWGLLHASVKNESGETYEYSDLSDVMSINVGHLNAPHLIEMGWIDQSDIQEARGAGSYAVESLYGVKTGGGRGRPGSGTKITSERPRIVRVQVPFAEKGRSFLISYRGAYGFSNSSDSFFVGKVNIHEFEGFSSNTHFRAGLEVGQSFSDFESGVRITVTELDETGAKFTLNGPCVRRAPNVRIDAVGSNIDLPAQLKFTIQNTNSFCAPEIFSLYKESSPALQLLSLPSILQLSSGENRIIPLELSSPTPMLLNGLYSLVIGVRTGDPNYRDTSAATSFEFIGNPGAQASGLQLVSSSFVRSALYTPGPFAPGSLITAFGGNLSGMRMDCLIDFLPFPNRLCGTRLFLSNRRYFPLTTVVASQIDAQVPQSAPPGTSQVLTVATNTDEVKVSLPISRVAPEIYSTSGDLDGVAVARVKSSGKVVSNEIPAPVGQTVYLFGTGGGVATPAFADGTAPQTADTSLLARHSQVILSVPSEPYIEVRVRDLVGSKVPDQVGVDRYEVPIPVLPFGRVTDEQLRKATIRLCAVESEELADMRCSKAIGFPLKRD